MADSPEELEESHFAWEEKSGEKLDQARNCKEKVKKALHDLEKKQADKVAAIAEERRRQERLAAEAAARAKAEQERQVQERIKAQQAANLKAQQDALKASKRGEANALKQATADFKAARKAEHHATMKDRRIFDIKRNESALQNAYLACQKQYKMWFVAVKTCEMRLEARDKRPPSELFVDHVQSALDRELATLNEAREALKGLVDEGEKLTAEMYETSTLIVTAPSRENVLGRRQKVETMVLEKSSSTPSLPAIGKPKSPSQKEFVQSMKRLFAGDAPSKEQLLVRARDQVKRADELTEECIQVLDNCQKNCTKAIAFTNSSLDQRKREISTLRKTLEQEKVDAAGSIRDVSHRITMLKMKAHNLPQEGIGSHTEEDNEEIRAGEALLAQLHEAKLVLDEDWRNKSAAFNIDLFCRNLTPIRAATMFKKTASANATDTTALGGSIMSGSGNYDDQEDDYPNEFE